MNAFHVSYVTKVVDVRSVNLVGKLESREVDLEMGYFAWHVIDHNRIDNLDTWLDKFDGKRVRIYIECLNVGPDESALLMGKPDEPSR
jgi:hypothetical protein